MRFIVYIALVSTMVSAAPFGQWRPNPYGSATLAVQQDIQKFTGMKQAGIQIPEGRHKAVTVSTWIRWADYPGRGWMTTAAHITPERIQRHNKDLAEGQWGWGGAPISLTGGVALDGWEWQSYTNHPATATYWPRGVYTVNGWSSDGCTVTLGGTDYTFAAGGFTNNLVPGEGVGAILSGGGTAKVGISLTPCHFSVYVIDGVEEGGLLTADSIISNEWKMATFRWECVPEGLYMENTLGTREDWQSVSVPTTAGGVCDALDSRGSYSIGINGFGIAGDEYDLEFFDTRVFPWWLSDSELDRVHADGVIEMDKRGMGRYGE